MVAIPNFQITDAYLQEWLMQVEQLKKLRASEMLMRKAIFAHYFPNPKEGTNKVKLGNGYVLQADYKLDRAIDVSLFTVYGDTFDRLAIPHNIVRTKLELSVTTYKGLSEKQRHAFDQCLTIKPGSPSVKLNPPKGVA